MRAASGVAEAKNLQANSLLPAAPAANVGLQNDFIGSRNQNFDYWEVGVELPLWLPGQRKAREAIARETQNEVVSSRQSLDLEVAGLVRDAVWSFSMASGDAELAEAQYKTAQALQADVEKRWKAGELAKTDVMLAENVTLGAKNALLRAQAEVKHVEHRYWMLTGLKALPVSFEEILNAKDKIDDRHPWLLEANAKIETIHGQRDLTRIESRDNPQLQLSAIRERGGLDSLYNNRVGISVRIPLDAQVKSAPLLANVELEHAQAMAERDRRYFVLESALHEAAHNLETVSAQLVLLEQQYQLSQSALQLAKKSFALGESDLVSLLRSQATAYESERALMSLRTQQQWNIAKYNQAMGVLP